MLGCFEELEMEGKARQLVDGLYEVAAEKWMEVPQSRNRDGLGMLTLSLQRLGSYDAGKLCSPRGLSGELANREGWKPVVW